MIFIRDKSKWKICKLIADSRFIATRTMGVTDKEILFENMAKIIENLAELAFEIGGVRFATIDVGSCVIDLQDRYKKEQEMK